MRQGNRFTLLDPSAGGQGRSGDDEVTVGSEAEAARIRSELAIEYTDMMQRLLTAPARLAFHLGLLGLSALLALAVAAPVEAHDFWIDPSTYAPTVGETVQLTHRVGDAFHGDALARNPELLVTFSAVDAEGLREVPGVAGVSPAGAVPARVPGALLVSYESRGSEAVMDSATMVLYVEEEGIANQLPEGWQEDQKVRDVFSRSAKTLLAVAPAQPQSQGSEAGRESEEACQGFDHELGLPLELIPLNEPCALSGGGELGLRLLFDGEPAAAIRIAAVAAPKDHSEDDSEDDSEEIGGETKKLDGLTDDKGRITLVLPHGGRWLIKAVHIRPTGEASYRSHWASLTFQTR